MKELIEDLDKQLRFIETFVKEARTTLELMKTQ